MKLALVAALGLLSLGAQCMAEASGMDGFKFAAAADLTTPVGYINAYWPNHKDTDPETRIVRLTDPKSGIANTYEAIFKDPEDNDFDLSQEDSWDKMAEKRKADYPPEFYTWGLPEQGAFLKELQDKRREILWSAYLDENDNILYQTMGDDIPTSALHEKMYLQHFFKQVASLLDPNTPGLEDVKDPFSVMAQGYLNNIAMDGPAALENAKKNTVTMGILDALYEASAKFDELMEDLDEAIAEEQSEDDNGGKS